jgi:hypothetical protein
VGIPPSTAPSRRNEPIGNIFIILERRFMSFIKWIRLIPTLERRIDQLVWDLLEAQPKERIKELNSRLNALEKYLEISTVPMLRKTEHEVITLVKENNNVA